jgi:acetolactate synthase-1/3 small subunit
MSENYRTISVLVENEFGVLARVAGMFAARGFNIDALSVAPTTEPHMSRITLITHGNELIIEQILKQLNRLIDVIRVVDVSSEACIRRELMLVKLAPPNGKQKDFSEIVKKYQGKILDATDAKNLIIEFVGENEEMESILQSLEAFHILEVVRAGNIAMQKGKEILSSQGEK